MAGFEAAEHGSTNNALAKKIRSAVEQETFDLGGMTEVQVASVLTSAFNEPFPHLSGMIRLSFVVGGGKGVRTKYDDNMPKWCSQALKSIGFEEDKSASCDLSSKRTFKFHHDTGKNLKMFVVFPDVPEGALDAATQGLADLAVGEETHKRDEVDLVLNCPLAYFPAMMGDMAPSWTTRQKVLKDVLLPRVESMEGVEKKMVSGTQLDAQENQLYEMLSGASLREKVEWVTASMKTLVDQATLTAQDLDKLKKQVETKLEAAKAGNDKKAQAQVAALEERRAKLQAVTPITPPLKRQEQLKPLWRRLATLQLEKAAIKGRLLTMPELRKFSEMDRLEEQIAALVFESKTFFETEEELEARVKAAKKKAVAGVGAPKKKAATATTTAARSTGWASVGKKPAARGGGGAAKPASSGNAFSALGGDSDSD